MSSTIRTFRVLNILTCTLPFLHRDESTRCGTFLCAYNAVERLKADQETDIYTAVLQAKYRRPEFVPDLVRLITFLRK